ncbi:hypothetical protein Hanom_Chr13g01199491 [Helianthus anomalus]
MVNTTTVVQPPPSIPKKKSTNPTKPTNKGPLEYEILEVNPVTTPISLETTVATSSQQLERSQPETTTPHDSSQKEHVASTWTPQYEVLPSLESKLNSPPPMANSLSKPLPTSPIPPTIIPLFEAIEIQTQNNPSHQHITESTTFTLVVSEPIQFANPQIAEEDIPLEFPEF